MEYILQGDYGRGWEDILSEETEAEAREMLATYEENEYAPHRIIKRRTEA